MKSPFRLCVLTVLFAGAVLCWSGLESVGQEKGKTDVPPPQEKKGKFVIPPPPPRTQWEYKVQTIGAKDNDSFEKELNELGKEGWELGGAVKTNFFAGGTRKDTQYFDLIFKRPKR